MKKIFFILLFLSLLLTSVALAAEDLTAKLSGQVLVATESQGEIWYVNPVTQERQYLGKPEEFLGTMRQVAIGVAKKDFESFKGKAPQRLAGKFLLLVDESGKIAYVNPADLKVHKFDNTNDALEGMKKLALGINNTNLNKIKANQETTKTAVASDKVKSKTDKASSDESDDTATKWQQPVQGLSTDNLKWIAEKYINNVLITNGSATVINIKSVFGIYALTIKLSTQEKPITSYISPDGKMFFPQGLNIEEGTASNDDTTEEADDDKLLTKQKPEVELFVMSHCPFGTQIEKGILPVVTALGETIDFKVKFVDYAMHGEVEVKEELRQYCIQKEQPDKFLGYLTCFLQAGEGTTCLATSAVDTAALATCITKADTEFSVTKNYEDRASWLSGNYPRFNIFLKENQTYGVEGSPTLVLNGQTVNSGRDSASLLKTICQGFITKPAACATVLSSSVPATGFGTGITTNTNNAACH
ncbi:MAG: hypothetical protein V1765_01170 [bacterium]